MKSIIYPEISMKVEKEWISKKKIAMYLIWTLYLLYFVFWVIKRKPLSKTKIYEFNKMNFKIIHERWKTTK